MDISKFIPKDTPKKPVVQPPTIPEFYVDKEMAEKLLEIGKEVIKKEKEERELEKKELEEKQEKCDHVFKIKNYYLPTCLICKKCNKYISIPEDDPNSIIIIKGYKELERRHYEKYRHNS